MALYIHITDIIVRHIHKHPINKWKPLPELLTGHEVSVHFEMQEQWKE